VRDNGRVAGSVDVDTALRSDLPNAPRWDYGIGYRPSANASDAVHWVEIHAATDGDIKAVEKKLEWLQSWVGINAPLLAGMDSRFVWVSSGRTRFTPTALGLKRLAKRGYRHVGRVYDIR